MVWKADGEKLSLRERERKKSRERKKDITFEFVNHFIHAAS